MNLHSTIIMTGFSVALGFAGPAAAGEWTVDKSHTHVLFEVNHLGFSTVHGGFKEISGTVNLDEENPEKTTVDMTIDAASVFTWHDKRDAHLRHPDFFNVEKFPTLTFKSTKVERTGENTAKMTGDLTILDVTKPVVLDVTLNRKAPRRDKVVAGFSATGALKRSEFGLNYGIPALGDDVKITVEIEIGKPAQ